MIAVHPPTTSRRIVRTASGYSHGGITRLMSPGDLGEWVKPFVFLDAFAFTNDHAMDLPMHPHSGIATLTTVIEGSVTYRDSTGKSGVLEPNSVEWMKAGGGVWHTGGPVPGAPIRGFQLWIALPEAQENGPPESHYLQAASIPDDGRVRVLLGTYDGVRGPIPYDAPVLYLHVRLTAGEAWTFHPPEGHDVAWLAVGTGTLHAADNALRRELAIFEEGHGAIELVAVEDTDFVIGSAVRHPHPLVLGSYSVHTSPEALRLGQAGIARVAAELRAGR